MSKFSNYLTFKNFLIISLLINIIFAFLFTPMIIGDAKAYIELSKQIAGDDSQYNLVGKSPLISVLISPFINNFNIHLASRIIIVIQFLMVFLSSLLTYRLFERIINKQFYIFLIGLLFILNLSTVYYATIILSETLTLFIFILSLYYLFKFYEEINFFNVILCGIIVALLLLARFNLVPLIVIYSAIIIYCTFKNSKYKISKKIFTVILFFLSMGFVLNIWSIYNLNKNGFYGLFYHGSGLVSRNAVVATIHEGNYVSEENKEILKIFLDARNKYLEGIPEKPKGSFTNIDSRGLLFDLYSGYPIYQFAVIELRKYFNSYSDSGKIMMNSKMKVFYEEIAEQNKMQLYKLRLLSFLSTFRPSSGGALPEKYGNINLNIMPSVFFKIYKIIIVILSVINFIGIITYLILAIFKKIRTDFYVILISIFTLSFYGINFVFCTLNDANRYKYPAEPLILGLTIYFFSRMFENKKYKIKHK